MIEVNQVDLEAAARLLVGNRVGGGDGNTYTARQPTIAEAAEAFARHRIAASTAERDVELREAAIRGALCLSAFAGEGVFIEGHEDPCDAWSRIMDALDLTNGTDDDLRAALAAVPPANPVLSSHSQPETNHET